MSYYEGKMKPINVIARTTSSEAVQLTKENFDDVRVWCKASVSVRMSGPAVLDIPSRDGFIFVACLGDWIVYDREHGYRVFGPEKFRRLFKNPTACEANCLCSECIV